MYKYHMPCLAIFGNILIHSIHACEEFNSIPARTSLRSKQTIHFPKTCHNTNQQDVTEFTQLPTLQLLYDQVGCQPQSTRGREAQCETETAGLPFLVRRYQTLI